MRLIGQISWLDGRLHPLSLTVELPQVATLEELAQLVYDINLVFTKLSGSEAPATAVQNFDTGSFYIELIPPEMRTLLLILAVARAALYLLRETIRLIEELKRNLALGLVAEDIDASVSQKRKLRALLVRRLAKDVGDNHMDSKTEDDVELIAGLIEREQRMIERGMRLIPASAAPKEVKDAMPDFRTPIVVPKMPPTLESKIDVLSLLPPGSDPPKSPK